MRGVIYISMAPPSCTIEELDDFDPSAFDKELSDVLLKGCKGDTKQFLTTVLGFLQRKTNFFKGDDPKKRVLEAYREVRPAMQAWKYMITADGSSFIMP